MMLFRKPQTPHAMVAHFRRLYQLVSPPLRFPPGVRMLKTTLANEPAVPPGMPAITVSTEQPQMTVLYLHGGAFVSGAFPIYASICGRLAKELNARVYWVDYRQAPEMPFPAAGDDAFQAYLALAKNFPDQPIAVIGDSAGGNLTLATLLRLRDHRQAQPESSAVQMPGCAVALSPAADLAGEPPSRRANARSDCTIKPEFIRFASQLYLGDHDPHDPYASPVYGDYAGLPPLLLTVSEVETLRDDSYMVAQRARDAGVAVEIISREDAPHAWPVLCSLLPEARSDLRNITKFISRHCAPSAVAASGKPSIRLARVS
jgi:acetyl esterase/lipase